MFWKNDSTAFVELSTVVYPAMLSVFQDSMGIHKSMELKIVVVRKNDDSSLFIENYHLPITLKDSTEIKQQKGAINKFIYTLKSGEYRIMIFGYDEMNYRAKDSILFQVNIEKKKKIECVSDVELCSNIDKSSDMKDCFYKNTYRVIPNPSQTYNVSIIPVVFTYVELYNLKKDMPYVLKTQIVNAKHDIIKSQVRKYRFSGVNVVDISTMNISSIVSGKYNFEYMIMDTVNNEIDKAEKRIYIYNPKLKQENGSLTSKREAEYFGMSAEELIKEFETEKYIADDEDIKVFKTLKNSDAYRAFLTGFWLKIENSTVGKEGLTRQLYLDRVMKANNKFKEFTKEGWSTDRGRVYILYGEPDEIERVPNTSESKPYEIWHYNQIEGGVEFDFVDRNGFGQYSLVNSTKRGELQDNQWQQYLR